MLGKFYDWGFTANGVCNLIVSMYVRMVSVLTRMSSMNCDTTLFNLTVINSDFM